MYVCTLKACVYPPQRGFCTTLTFFYWFFIRLFCDAVSTAEHIWHEMCEKIVMNGGRGQGTSQHLSSKTEENQEKPQSG
jgi:hypothetical protein